MASETPYKMIGIIGMTLCGILMVTILWYYIHTQLKTNKRKFFREDCVMIGLIVITTIIKENLPANWSEEHPALKYAIPAALVLMILAIGRLWQNTTSRRNPPSPHNQSLE